MRVLRAHSAAARRAWLVLGSVSAAYLWAVVTGNGLHGLKDTAELDKGGPLPDANVAFIAAIGLVFISCFMRAYLGATVPRRPIRLTPLGSSFAACLVVGGIVFVVALGVSAVV